MGTILPHRLNSEGAACIYAAVPKPRTARLATEWGNGVPAGRRGFGAPQVGRKGRSPN